MANEISLTISASLTNGNLKDTFSPGQIQVTQTTPRLHNSVVAAATTAEVLVLGDITDVGYAFFRNLDATNFVHIGVGTTGGIAALVKLMAGQVCCMPLTTGSTFMVEADTSPVELRMTLWAR